MSRVGNAEHWRLCREFALEFFPRNPDASVHAAAKACNNARVPVVMQVLQEERAKETKRRLEAMMVNPAMPETANGPRLVAPPPPQPEPTPPPPPQPVVQKEPEPMSNSTSNPTVSTKPVLTPVATTERDSLTAIARQLQAAMRQHGLGTVLLTLDDNGPTTSVTWEVTRKKADTVSITL